MRFLDNFANLSDPRSIFEIDNLSISLDVTLRSFASCSPSLVQLTGTRIDHASNAIGTKILSLKKTEKTSKKTIALKMKQCKRNNLSQANYKQRLKTLVPCQVNPQVDRRIQPGMIDKLGFGHL